MVGYRRLPCSDPKEQELRTAYYEAKGNWLAEGSKEDGAAARRYQEADTQLSKYIRERNEAEHREYKMKHPKKFAKEAGNSGAAQPGGRYLP